MKLNLELGKVHCFDVLEGLAKLPGESVQCCITSPPYWGLRSYNVEGQYGLEKTLEAYIEKMVKVFREVRRVLRKDGTLWLVMGDSYSAASTHGGGNKVGPLDSQATLKAFKGKQRRFVDSLKPKDLCMIPARLAIALQADGWYLRSMIPWLKRSAMPESCKDRPTSAVEYIFLLTKSARYFYDGEAVKVRLKGSTVERCKSGWHGVEMGGKRSEPDAVEEMGERWGPSSGRSRRNSDWFFESWRGLWNEGGDPLALIVNPAGFKEAHFATFPEGLVMPLIKAGTSEKGCCQKCGAPQERVMEKEKSPRDYDSPVRRGHANGWQPTCSCEGEWKERHIKVWDSVVDFEVQWVTKMQKYYIPPPDQKLDPCLVLDPFAGSGTVGVVAWKLNRRFIGLDLNPDYCEMANRRIRNPYAKRKRPPVSEDSVIRPFI